MRKLSLMIKACCCRCFCSRFWRAVDGAAPANSFQFSQRQSGAHAHAAVAGERIASMPALQCMTDPASGYPVEGWNQEPKKALLRSSRS